MKKTVVVHQPDFLPHLGFFHKFLHSDLWVILDNVQFLPGSKSWHNRDQIKTSQGARWLTVSVQRATLGTKINEILLSENTDWRTKNLNLLKTNYRKAPYFAEIMPAVKKLYSFETNKLSEFNINGVSVILELLGISIPSIKASQLSARGKSNELLVSILTKVGATHYLSGTGAKEYFDSEPYELAGIKVVWDKFIHPVYPQLFGQFIAGLSVIDMLFNCGIDKSRKIIRGDT